jgi:hypothetical protein
MGSPRIHAPGYRFPSPPAPLPGAGEGSPAPSPSGEREGQSPLAEMPPERATASGEHTLDKRMIT